MVHIHNFNNQRLGNQLFMISNAYAFALRHGDALAISHWKYKECFHDFNIQPETSKHFVNSVYDENRYGFHYNEIPYSDNLMLSGYFQSEKYFKDYEPEIRKLFSWNTNLLSKLMNSYADVINDENTCAVHIRRTDYLEKQEYHPVMNLDYYTQAMQYMGDRTFVFFSDDIEWCKSNFTSKNFIFIEGQSDIEDLCLMSLMKHNIIANSSFSWWGAWLNSNINKQIVAPKTWFGPAYSKLNTSDVLPETWHKI